MSSPQDPEQDLSQRLSRQAELFDQRGGSTLGLDDVLARAGEIRRGRRLRASMVMAAVVLAVAVPVGITTLGANDPTKPPETLPAASTTPTVRNTGPIALGDLETGALPRTGYLYDDRLFGENGPIDITGLSDTREIARIEGGYLISTDDGNGNLTANFLADDGTRGAKTWPMASQNFGASADGRIGALVEADGTVLAIENGGRDTFEVGTLPTGNGLLVSAVSGSTCAEPSSCTIFVSDVGERPRAFAVRPDQEPSEIGGDFIKLDDVSVDGRYAGLLSVDELEQSSCSQVTDAQFKPIWKTCDYSLDAFSPDGKYLLATPKFASGSGNPNLPVLDSATGKPVLDLKTAPDTVVYSATWEDNTHILATVFKGTDWSVIRFDLNGNREYAVGVTPTNEDFAAPFTLG